MKWQRGLVPKNPTSAATYLWAAIERWRIIVSDRKSIKVMRGRSIQTAFMLIYLYWLRPSKLPWCHSNASESSRIKHRVEHNADVFDHSSTAQSPNKSEWDRLCASISTSMPWKHIETNPSTMDAFWRKRRRDIARFLIRGCGRNAGDRHD